MAIGSVVGTASAVLDWPITMALSPVAAQAPTSNTNAVCTLAADTTGKSWRMRVLTWSYSGTPTAGTITIVWGTNTETYAITNGGPGFLPLQRAFPPNTAVVLTLAAGGSGVTGTIYANAFLD